MQEEYKTIKIYVIGIVVVFALALSFDLYNRYFVGGVNKEYNGIQADTIEYKEIRDNTTKYIEEQTNKKDSLTYEYKYKIEQVKALDDSASVELFKKLSSGGSNELFLYGRGK